MWYRLYELDEGDHILKAESLEFPSDADAMAEARDRAGLRGIEVWQGPRRVGRVGRVGRERWLRVPVSSRPSPA